MYAHQVIDAIESGSLGITLPPSDERGFVKALFSVSRSIKNAQHFHLGEAADYSTYARKYKGHPVFHNETMEGVKLPYPCCWFDYMNSMECALPEGKIIARKRSILAYEWEDMIFVLPFYSYSGIWVVSPISFCIPDSINRKQSVEALKCLKENRDLQRRFLSLSNELIDKFGVGWSSKDAPIDYDMLCKFMEDGGLLPIPAYPLNNVDLHTIIGRLMEFRDDLETLNMALMLLSCRNIGTEKHDPPIKLNKKRQKSGKQTLFTFHTLVLRPVGNKQKSTPKHLWNNRIHLARGHFKSYTKERPLFGSITGRFWWQPHVRGRNKDGIVMKDYVLNPSNDGTWGGGGVGPDESSQTP